MAADGEAKEVSEGAGKSVDGAAAPDPDDHQYIPSDATKTPVIAPVVTGVWLSSTSVYKNLRLLFIMLLGFYAGELIVCCIYIFIHC